MVFYMRISVSGYQPKIRVSFIFWQPFNVINDEHHWHCANDRIGPVLHTGDKSRGFNYLKSERTCQRSIRFPQPNIKDELVTAKLTYKNKKRSVTYIHKITRIKTFVSQAHRHALLTNFTPLSHPVIALALLVYFNQFQSDRASFNIAICIITRLGTTTQVPYIEEQNYIPVQLQHIPLSGL